MTPGDILERLGAKFCYFCKDTSQLGYLRRTTTIICYECALNYVEIDQPIISVWEPM